MSHPIFDDESALNEEVQIDLTPMLDVVFIMLIFFVVTASFVQQVGIDIQIPEASTAEQSDIQHILIAITETNEIWLDKRRIDIRSVRANVARLHAENPSAALIIQADKNAKVDTLTKVADAARAAGVTDFSIASSQP